MKRINNLFSSIYAQENIELADRKARRNKRKRQDIISHDKDATWENFMLSMSLKYGEYRTSKYTTFKVYEPKERIIFKLPYYPDRITHHAIMNVLGPIWDKVFTRDTYSSIKGRGIHTLLRKLKSDLLDSRTKYCLKLDIRKFYPSINHDILKLIIRKKIKDKQLLEVLDEIIDSADGVPIGNYLSLYFANLYLAYFDHWVKEELKVGYYYRYADDIVILSDNKDLLRNWLLAIKIYLKHVLKLQIKDNYQIFPIDKRGIDFVGYVFYHTHIKIRKSIKNNIKRLIAAYHNKEITWSKMKARLSSYFGWLKYCNSKNLLYQISKQTFILYAGWDGLCSTFRKFKDKTVKLVNVESRDKYMLIQFTYKDKSYYIKSTDNNLGLFLNTMQLPTLMKISNVNCTLN